jgi:predicted nucleic acid-binding protein
MTAFVLDASIVISLLLQEKAEYSEEVFKKHLARRAVAHVPSLWYLEIRNVLFLKVRAKSSPPGRPDKLLPLCRF